MKNFEIKLQWPLGQTKLICWGTDFSQNNLGRLVGKKMIIKKICNLHKLRSMSRHVQNTEISTACIFRKKSVAKR